MSPPPTPDDPRTPLAQRVFLLCVGSVALGLGVVGVVLPLVPTTPFVLLAAGCYARAWPPAHRWLRANRYFGPICRSGDEGRYLPPRAKVVAVLLTVGSFTATLLLAPLAWPLRAAIGALGLVVTVWLIRMPTRPRLARVVADSQ